MNNSNKKVTKQIISKKDALFLDTPVLKAILKIAVPGLIMMLFLALYTLMDFLISLYFGTKGGDISHIVTSADIRSCMSATSPISTLAFAFISWIAIGSSSRIPILLGKKDKNIDSFIGTSITSIFCTAAIVILIFSPLSSSIINSQIKHSSQHIMNQDSVNLNAVHHQAWWYINIYLWGLPMYALAFYTGSLLRNEGFIYVAVVSNIISSLLNGGLDMLFLAKFHWSLLGSAISTDISWFFNLLVMYIFAFRKRSQIIFFGGFKKLKIKWEFLLIILFLGASTVIRNAGMSFSVYITNIIVNHLPGPPKYNSLQLFKGFYVSLFGAIGQIMIITIIPLFGIIQASSSFIGYNLAKKEFQRIRKAIIWILVLSTSYLAFIQIFIEVFPQLFLNIFEGDLSNFANSKQLYNQMYHQIGQVVIRLMYISFPLIGIQITTQSIFQSLNKPFNSAITSSLRYFIVFVPIIITMMLITNATKIWWLFWTSWAFTDLISSIISSILGIKTYKNIENVKILEVRRKIIAK